jgi:hypothetical protein
MARIVALGNFVRVVDNALWVDRVLADAASPDVLKARALLRAARRYTKLTSAHSN